MAVSGISPISGTLPFTTGITRVQEPVAAPAAVPQPAPQNTALATMATITDEAALEAAIQAALARAQVMVGAANAEDIVNDSGTIDYLELARIIAEQREQMQAQGVNNRPSTQPVNIPDIFA